MEKETKEPNIKSPDEVVIEEKVSMEETIPTPRSLENLPAEPKPKKRVGLAIMLVVLVLLLVGGALATGYLWGNNNQSQSQNSNNTNSSSTSEEQGTSQTQQEVELTDATLKKDISDKVAILHGRKSDDGNIALSSFSTGILGPIAYQDLSSEEKLRFVLDLVLSNNTAGLSQNERDLAKTLMASDPSKYAGVGTYAPNFSVENYDYYSNIKSLPIETVEAKYYDLFGENPELLEETRGRIVETCSLYVYSKENNSYLHFSPSGCGSPVTNAGGIFYVYDYTSSGEYIYVYIATGIVKSDLKTDSNGVKSADGASILTDFVGTKLYDTDDAPVYKKFADMEEATEFQIDETNYQNFSKYRLVFEKNDKGTYSFKRAEKVE